MAVEISKEQAARVILPRHKYVVVFGSCCTADAIRPKNLEDIAGSMLRLVCYQGRTSPVSIRSEKLLPAEFCYLEERYNVPERDWGLAMVEDEVEKRHHIRLLEVIEMTDAVLIDTVSTFVFPYLLVEPGERYFLRSKEWDRYVALRIEYGQRRLLDFPIELSILGLRELLQPLYEKQPNLRVIFHFPRPCFNDGIRFDDPEVAANLDYYDRYNERLYLDISSNFPRVAATNCCAERADPLHYNYQFPFHYQEDYMNALRKDVERLLD